MKKIVYLLVSCCVMTGVLFAKTEGVLNLKGTYLYSMNGDYTNPANVKKQENYIISLPVSSIQRVMTLPSGEVAIYFLEEIRNKTNKEDGTPAYTHSLAAIALEGYTTEEVLRMMKRKSS